MLVVLPEAALHRCSYKKLFWKYAANLQENNGVVFNKVAIFIEITLPHVCFPLNLLYIFRTPFYKNTYEGLLLYCLHVSFPRSSQENAWKKSTTKRIVKLQAVWLQIYWKQTSLHVLLRSFTNNISFFYTIVHRSFSADCVYTPLQFRSIYFQGTPLWS